MLIKLNYHTLLLFCFVNFEDYVCKPENKITQTKRFHQKNGSVRIRWTPESNAFFSYYNNKPNNKNHKIWWHDFLFLFLFITLNQLFRHQYPGPRSMTPLSWLQGGIWRQNGSKFFWAVLWHPQMLCCEITLSLFSK